MYRLASVYIDTEMARMVSCGQYGQFFREHD